MIKFKVLLLLIILSFTISTCAQDTKEQLSTEKVDNDKPVEKTEVIVSKEKEKPKVTFVELGSTNCIPCKQMQPIMKAIEEEYPTQVKVEFIDVWTTKGKIDGRKYNVRLIPTQVFLDSLGKEYYRHEGFFPKDKLVEVLKKKGVK
ncbi:MAG: thioredoxin family protein [Candidatus Delongbacteria bacterium]|nr:thioredoxin family protein [Candidatus Delongbacteria bacterium]